MAEWGSVKKRMAEDPVYAEKLTAYKRDFMRRNGHKYTNPHKMAENRVILKNAVINILTNGEGTCRMCGQGDQDVLCVDHINDNGADHRRTDPRTNNGRIWRWLMQNDYPTGFQILCFNCNTKKEIIRRRANRESMLCR